MINIAICDDISPICSHIETIVLNYCKKIFKTVNIEIYYSGETLIENIRKNNKYYDIIFLDIVLGKLSGIEVGEIIRTEFKNYTTQIVYVSAYTDYAMKLFSSMPFGFLVKPFNEADVEEIIGRWIRIFDDSINSFMYKIDREIFKVKIDEILFFESVGRGVRIVTTDKTDIFYGNLKDVFAEINKVTFIYTHRAYLINVNHVIKIKYDSLTMSNSDTIPISKTKRKELKKFFLENNILK